MAKNQTYSSIVEAEAAAGASPKFTARLAERLRKRSIVNHMVALRGAKGLSQADIASRLGCTQSKVSKLENSEDEDVRLGDIRAYASAIGLDLGVLFAQKGMGCVGRIKAHAFQIHSELNRMVEMAKGDSEMTYGVVNFHGEAAVNMLLLIRDSLALLTREASKLRDCPDSADDDGEILIEMRVSEQSEQSDAEQTAPA